MVRDAGWSAHFVPCYLRNERVLFYLYNQNIKRLAWFAETTVRGLRGRPSDVDALLTAGVVRNSYFLGALLVDR